MSLEEVLAIFALGGVACSALFGIFWWIEWEDRLAAEKSRENWVEAHDSLAAQLAHRTDKHERATEVIKAMTRDEKEAREFIRKATATIEDLKTRLADREDELLGNRRVLKIATEENAAMYRRLEAIANIICGEGK